MMYGSVRCGSAMRSLGMNGSSALGQLTEVAEEEA